MIFSTCYFVLIVYIYHTAADSIISMIIEVVIALHVFYWFNLGLVWR